MVSRVLLFVAFNGPAIVKEDSKSSSSWFTLSTAHGFSGNDEMPVAHGDALVVNPSRSQSSKLSCP